jgi:hypothetical protein
VFSGTGLSIVELTNEYNGGKAKMPVHAIEPVFADFKPLAADEVKTYIAGFLDLQAIGEGVQDHVAKWLSGRPRWTATFLEEYLYRIGKDVHSGTRGVFNDQEAKLVEALDRFIIVMTSEHGKDHIPGKPGHSWSAGGASAYAAIMEVNELDNPKSNLNIQKDLDKAVFNFAAGKEFFPCKHLQGVSRIWRCCDFEDRTIIF